MGLQENPRTIANANRAGTACLACGEKQFTLWYTKTSTLDGRAYPIFRCSGCHSAFVVPRPETGYLEQYYSQDHSPHATAVLSHPKELRFEKLQQSEREFPNSTVDASRIALTCRKLAKGRRFLDVGAGFGFFSKAALDCDYEVTALEPSSVSRNLFRQLTGLEAVPTMLTAEFVQANAGSFDVVLLSQVLEHVADLDSLVPSLHLLLAPDGIAAIAVPHFGSLLSRLQGRNDMFISPPEHLNYFSRQGLIALFTRRGMECCQAETVSRVNLSRVQKRIPVPILSRPLSLGIRAALQFSDSFHMGMFLNLYFRKSAGAAQQCNQEPAA